MGKEVGVPRQVTKSPLLSFGVWTFLITMQDQASLGGGVNVYISHSNGVVLPEIHLLPHHGAPHAEESPEVAQRATVERILVGAAMLEVGDAMA